MSIFSKTSIGLKYQIHLKLPNKSDIDTFVLKVDTFVLKVDLATPEFDSIRPMVAQAITYKPHLNLDPSVLFDSDLFFDKVVLHLVRNKDIERWLNLSAKLSGYIEKSGMIASGFIDSPEKSERIALDNVKIESKLKNEITVSVDYRGRSF